MKVKKTTILEFSWMSDYFRFLTRDYQMQSLGIDQYIYMFINA